MKLYKKEDTAASTEDAMPRAALYMGPKKHIDKYIHALIIKSPSQVSYQAPSCITQ